MKSSIAFSPVFKPFATVVGTGPGQTRIEVSEQTLRLRMGWAFNLATSLNNVAGARVVEESKWWWGYGVHKIGSRKWIANGTLDNLVEITFKTPVKANAIGFPITAEAVIVSAENPADLVARLGA